MLTTATGTLTHHFWGEYYADIVLAFPTPWQATAGAKRLGPDWLIHGTRVARQVPGHVLEKTIKPQLAKLGADRDKIDSVARSINHGEPFTITMELEHPSQMKLPL